MNDEHPLILGIVRYGLPLVVALFYLTASLAFDYTPDSTYTTLQAARDVAGGGEAVPGESAASQNPLWVFFVALGIAVHLDALLTAKVFSLFFSSLGILLTYLVAHEILRERLVAFLATLVLAMQSTTLQLAPTGTPLAMAVVLSLAGMFFMLRNEYLLAAIFTGLCTLLYWQGTALFAILVADLWINSTHKPRAVKVISSTVLVYLSVLLPWILYSAMSGSSVIPLLVPFGEFPEFDWKEITGIAVVSALALAGFALHGRGEEHTASLRNHAAPLAWGITTACFGVVAGAELWVLSIPFAVFFGFQGLQVLIVKLSRPENIYSAAFLLTALLLTLSQLSFVGNTRGVMVQKIDESLQLMPIAYWIKAHAPVDATVCTARCEGILSYYAGRDVVRTQGMEGDYIVGDLREKEGYEMIYVPEITGTISAYGVWRRR